jgi:hypothetical protein
MYIPYALTPYTALYSLYYRERGFYCTYKYLLLFFNQVVLRCCTGVHTSFRVWEFCTWGQSFQFIRTRNRDFIGCGQTRKAVVCTSKFSVTMDYAPTLSAPWWHPGIPTMSHRSDCLWLLNYQCQQENTCIELVLTLASFWTCSDFVGLHRKTLEKRRANSDMKRIKLGIPSIAKVTMRIPLGTLLTVKSKIEKDFNKKLFSFDR